MFVLGPLCSIIVRTVRGAAGALAGPGNELERIAPAARSGTGRRFAVDPIWFTADGLGTEVQRVQ